MHHRRGMVGFNIVFHILQNFALLAKIQLMFHAFVLVLCKGQIAIVARGAKLLLAMQGI